MNSELAFYINEVNEWANQICLLCSISSDKGSTAAFENQWPTTALLQQFAINFPMNWGDHQCQLEE